MKNLEAATTSTTRNEGTNSTNGKTTTRMLFHTELKIFTFQQVKKTYFIIFSLKDIASIMKVSRFLSPRLPWLGPRRLTSAVRGVVANRPRPKQLQPIDGWYDEADQSVGSPWGSGQSGAVQAFQPIAWLV